MNLNIRRINKKILVPAIAAICVCAGLVVFYITGGEDITGGEARSPLEVLYITSSDATLKAEYATLKAEYDTENQWPDTIEIKFGYKEKSSDTWNYTDWREISENEILYENISNLTPSTRYEFKAILQHDSEEISSSVCSFETYAIPLNYEASGIVEYTVDGDTVKVNVTWVNPSTEGVETGGHQSVRFSGGMDAPEMSMEGGEEAKQFVRNNFCSTWTEAFLDLDNFSYTPYHDVHGRLLGVIYVRKDGKWVNVNAEVLRWGMEAYPNHNWLQYSYYPSEFDADVWLADNYPYVLSYS